MFVKTGAAAVRVEKEEWKVDGERKGKKRRKKTVIIQAKGRINPDGPPPLLFLEDGSARNRERCS